MKYPDKYQLSPKEQAFLVRKNMVELIYNAGQFEGLNTTLLQTEQIIKYKKANDVSIDDILTIVNLKKGFELLGENTQNYFNFAKQVNAVVAAEDALEPGEIRTGNVTVKTPQGTYSPELPVLRSYEKLFSDFAKDKTATEAAIDLFLQLCKSQLFWDGNKRTALVTANKILYNAGAGVLTIPADDYVEFSKLLADFYHDENNIVAVKDFLYEKCIFGIDYA